MTIFIKKKPDKNKKEMPAKDLLKYIWCPDKFVKQIVKAWQESKIEHHFEKKKLLENVLWKNRDTLKHPKEIKMLFTSSNYYFSTNASGRLETLYFVNGFQKLSGRLRQQHPKGPLAQIDANPKTHLFLSRNRFDRLKRFHKKHKYCLPHFYHSEQHLVDGRYHIEFAYDGKVSGWHASEGIVTTNQQSLEYRINDALKEILGMNIKNLRPNQLDDSASQRVGTRYGRQR